MSKKDDLYDPLPDVERFVRRVLKRKDDTELAFMGIDPGLSGAIAFLCGKHYLVIDIPTIELTTKALKNTKAYNNAGIHRIFKALRPIKQDLVCFLEYISPSFGGKFAYAQAMIYGGHQIWPLYLYSRGIKTLEAHPQSWKSKMGLRGKDKEASRCKAVSLFPNAPLHRKMDQNRAESLLICRWGQQSYEGNL